MTKTQREQIVKLQENQFANGGGCLLDKKYLMNCLNDRQCIVVVANWLQACMSAIVKV